jgi:ABC-type multidrug transport system ATPase subunit
VVLTLTGVSKSFGGRPVLDRLDLQLGPGESVALLGANGSGKTTTLRCVVGLARPDAGRIAVGGFDAAKDGVEARRRLSYLPQKSMFPATLTVRETLGAVARLRTLPAGAVDRELELCGLRTLADRNVSRLSGGERQRLAIAVAFLPDVDLYLFDEPTANLDPAATRILIRRALALKRNGKTLLFTTHVPADVRHLATRILFLRDGRIEGDAAGEFELARYGRMLERDLLGDSHGDLVYGSRGGGADADGRRLRRSDAFTAAGAGGPR